MKKLIALLLTLAMVFGLVACGNNADAPGNASASASGDAKSVDFTYLILSSLNGDYMSDYDENPAIQYWMDMEWDADGDGTGTKINVDFWSPTPGSEQDYVNTLISTGDYPDVLSTAFTNEKAGSLYEDGIALDLTEYVDLYMPNYKAYMEAHPEIIFENNVDGENRIIQIYGVNDDYPEAWGGLMYRRDWIVKYGTNPETGEAFTGQWVGDEWEDDVVFPSGNTAPIYVTDWEWMLGIFETALAQQGITTGYELQLPYTGPYATGELLSGFGGIGSTFYFDENGDVVYGADSEGMRAFTECMTTWYNNGWINVDFAERADEMFFMVDMASVYSGQVGVWYGLISQLMGAMDPKDGSNPWLDGAVVYACASPINDKYGDPSTQNCKPTVYYSESLLGQSFVITDKAEDKDIPALLTAIDFMYSPEGALVNAFGISKEQMAAAEGTESWYQTYIEWGLEEGAYYLVDNGDGTNLAVRNPICVNAADSLSTDASATYTAGLHRRGGVDNGYTDGQQYAQTMFKLYTPSGVIGADLTSQLDGDTYGEYSTVSNDTLTVIAQWIPLFIKGTYDVKSDADWALYTAEIEALGADEVTAALQAVVDLYK